MLPPTRKIAIRIMETTGDAARLLGRARGDATGPVRSPGGSAAVTVFDPRLPPHCHTSPSTRMMFLAITFSMSPSL